MCDDKIFQDMKGLQVKVPDLTCNPGPYCWCANLSFRVPAVENEDCISPNDLLRLFGKEMSDKDVQYLNSLKNRRFIK
jgi:hypothetical protein